MIEMYSLCLKERGWGERQRERFCVCACAHVEFNTSKSNFEK
jgi:hypothetical protein